MKNKRKDPAKSIEEYILNNSKFNDKCFKDKCKEKGCGLKGATSKSYLILDGDEIEKLKSKKKSVDCIIIKNEYNDKKITILFIELKTGKSKIEDIKEKFENSFKTFHEINQEINLNKFNPEFICIGMKFKTLHERRKKRTTLINTYQDNKKNFKIKNCGCLINELF
ncbi:MAG: hypothetical protein LBM96_13035 [Methanobrevibacter sp.]|jgi:hypothetical protein|nr:hypothetical protein [Candidatus Methanoflexus mossambicus]